MGSLISVPQVSFYFSFLSSSRKASRARWKYTRVCDLLINQSNCYSLGRLSVCWFGFVGNHFEVKVKSLWKQYISLHNRRFLSQARRTRHFARSATRARRGEEKLYSFSSPRLARVALRASREMPRSPRLAQKPPVMQANNTLTFFLSSLAVSFCT